MILYAFLLSYQRALDVCSVAGVLQDALDDLELLKRISKPVIGVEKASQLLRHALAAGKQSPSLRPIQMKTSNDREQAETARSISCEEKASHIPWQTANQIKITLTNTEVIVDGKPNRKNVPLASCRISYFKKEECTLALGVRNFAQVLGKKENS